MLKSKLLVLFLFVVQFSFSQNLEYAKEILDTLCSKHMHGRGYVNNGDKIAADYIANEFEKLSLQKFNNSYFQRFSFPINTFPDTISLHVNGKKLIPGEQFLVAANAKSIEGSFDAIDIRSMNKPLTKLRKTNITNKFLIVDVKSKGIIAKLRKKPLGIITIEKDKLWWHVSNATTPSELVEIKVDSSSFPYDAEKIDLKINSKFIKHYNTQNIIAFVEGKSQPDSFLVFSAHYDHLGRMGNKVYFPGANDNASGVAMLLNLAEYFSKEENKPECSIAFMAFSAEEVGILGSYFYTQNPFFPLNNIQLLVNLDLVGTGEEGIKVVNGSVLKKEFDLLREINKQKGYLKDVKPRGEAANSDHYFFHKNGVKSFFIYTLGGIAEYHNIYDKAETLPMTEFTDIIKLLIDFTNELCQKKTN